MEALKKKIKYQAKPINNRIVISDEKTAEWFVSELSKPLTKERIERNKTSLQMYEDLFFAAR